MKVISKQLQYYYDNKEACAVRHQKWEIKNRKKRAKYRREYKKTITGKIAAQKAAKKYRIRNKERKLAWEKVENYPVCPCEVCGKLPSQKHHTDYSKPLKIKYLCALHHKEWHKNNNAVGLSFTQTNEISGHILK